MATIVAGFDPGNAQTTLALRIGRQAARCHTAPSYVGSGNLQGLLKMRRGTGSDLLDDDEYAIELDGSMHFVGRLAREQSRSATTARGSLARYSNGHTLRLLLGQCGRLFKEPVTLRLVTGLPIKFWSEDAKRQIQTAFCKTWRYTWNDKPREVTIESVGVLMEGAAALYDVAGEAVNQVVADAGGGTLDLYWAVGRRPQYERCASFDDCGVDVIGDLLRAKARDLPHGRTITHDEVTAVLHAYAHKAEPPKLMSQGQPLVLDGEVAAAVRAVGELQLARVHQAWDDEDGRAASASSYARLIGGGAYYFKELYKATIPHIEIAAQPERANALAYLAVADAATDEMWARNRG